MLSDTAIALTQMRLPDSIVVTKGRGYAVVKGMIPFELAEKLYADPVGRKHIRVAGHCGCPSPDEWARHYNVEGLPIVPEEKHKKELDSLSDSIRGIYLAQCGKSYVVGMGNSVGRFVSLYHIDTPEALGVFVDMVEAYFDALQPWRSLSLKEQVRFEVLRKLIAPTVVKGMSMGDVVFLLTHLTNTVQWAHRKAKEFAGKVCSDPNNADDHLAKVRHFRRVFGKTSLFLNKARQAHQELCQQLGTDVKGYDDDSTYVIVAALGQTAAQPKGQEGSVK